MGLQGDSAITKTSMTYVTRFEAFHALKRGLVRFDSNLLLRDKQLDCIDRKFNREAMIREKIRVGRIGIAFGPVYIMLNSLSQ